MNALNVNTLVYKTKEELLELMQEQLELAVSPDEDELYQALQNMEQVIYVLKNCEYKK